MLLKYFNRLSFYGDYKMNNYHIESSERTPEQEVC